MIIGGEKRKKKNIILIIIIVAILLILIILGLTKFKESNFKQYDLSYEELEEDIKSIKKNGEIINAKYIETEYDTSPSYQGDGYVIIKILGADASEFIIYHDEEVIWKYVKKIL